MASLTDLFNPTFLMFLGILVLVVALLVVYFESKMREQNHKIASMLSLVSTLAEDMNNVKMGLNHLAIRGGQEFQQQNLSNESNLGRNEIRLNNNLIEVSDDEETDNEETDNEETDNEETDNEETDDEETDDEVNENSDLESVEDNGSINQTKVIKLKVSAENSNEDNNSYEETIEPTEDLGDFEGDFEPIQPEVNNDYVEEVLDLKYTSEEQQNENSLVETNIPLYSDLKTISINLGEEHHHNEDNIDYKKLQLPKLRTIAIEKGLTTNSEASKLKKPELLKLLGAE